MSLISIIQWFNLCLKSLKIERSGVIHFYYDNTLYIEKRTCDLAIWFFFFYHWIKDSINKLRCSVKNLSKIYCFQQKALDYIYIRYDKKTCSLRKPSSHSFQLKSYLNSVPQYIPLIKKAYFIFRFCSQFFWCHFRNLTQAEISWNKKPNYCLVFIWKKMQYYKISNEITNDALDIDWTIQNYQTD